MYNVNICYCINVTVSKNNEKNIFLPYGNKVTKDELSNK